MQLDAEISKYEETKDKAPSEDSAPTDKFHAQLQ